MTLVELIPYLVDAGIYGCVIAIGFGLYLWIQ